MVSTQSTWGLRVNHSLLFSGTAHHLQILSSTAEPEQPSHRPTDPPLTNHALETLVMWRRVFCWQLKTLAPCRSSLHKPAAALANRPLIPPPASAPLSSRLFSAESADSAVKKRVEDVMPIATGHEREAQLEGKDILEIHYPVGPFGTKVSGSFYQNGRSFSTSVPNDPDTHEDFRPASKLENSGTSLKDIVEQDVKQNPVMLYMKGVPDFPQCGFSSLAVRVLKLYNVPLSARNILENPELKNAVKAFSHWPTFPQVFIKGEFIGGSDIILSMHQNGELKEKLSDIMPQETKE